MKKVRTSTKKDDEGAKLGQGLAKAASMAKPATLSCVPISFDG